jgi:hypothetical protein
LCDNAVVRRRLFTFTSAVSLGLCLVTVVLWLESYSLVEGCTFSTGGYVATVCASFSGRVFLEREHLGRDDYPRPVAGMNRFQIAPRFFLPPPKALEAGGFGFWYLERRGAARWGMAIPDRAIVFATLLLPLLWVKRYRDRRSAGGCPKCRYNLTGNVSGVCPECGTAVTASGAPSA